MLTASLIGLLLTAPPQATDLPKWFDGARVQAHTRLPLKEMPKNPQRFNHAAQLFKKMDVQVFTRFIKSGREGAWWPSKVGVMAPLANGKNIAKQIIDEAHAEGLKMIAYHRMMEDDWAAKEHPDWVCETQDGKPYTANRGIMLCLNSPYVDYYQTRGVELVKMGVDGFQFDEEHMPASGCWNKYCKDAFRRETGLEPPKGKKLNDPTYQAYLDFQNRTIERAFKKWMAAFKAVNPNQVTIISASRWNSFGDRHLNDGLLRAADAIKTEFNVGLRRGNNKQFKDAQEEDAPDAASRYLLSWAMARDITEGRPAHVWVAGVKEERTALATASNLLAMGCVANMDIREEDLPDMRFQSTFALGQKVSPTLAGSRPMRWFGIYSSEQARDRYATNNRRAWEQAIFPVVGAYEVAYKARIPTAIVFDDDLIRNKMSGVRVLFIPAMQNLSPEAKAGIDRFKSAGGKVIEQRADWNWSSARGRRTGGEELLRQIKGAETPPFQVEGPGDVVTGFLTKGSQTIIGISPTTTWWAEGKPFPAGFDNNTGLKIRFRAQPGRVRDVVYGRELTVRKEGQSWVADVPNVKNLALFVVDP